MTRVRGAVLALVVALVAVAGWGTWAFHHAQQVRDEGAGRQDPAHLAAARAIVDRLTVPVGATRDPYASACRLITTYCITSTELTSRQLFDAVTAQIKTAHVRQYGTECVGEALIIDCVTRFDVSGAHIAVMSGKGAHLSASVSDTAAVLATQHRSLALGSWSSADPFPAGWVVKAFCTDTRSDGCHTYRSDRQRYQNETVERPRITGSATVRLAEAEQAVARAGFVLWHSGCTPATTQKLATCTLSGFRSRTLGGLDGEFVSLSLEQADTTHVALVGQISTT
jgi:hypothetical protein